MLSPVRLKPIPSPALLWLLACRFGGPGIKKKACLRRICLKARRDGAEDSEDDGQVEEESATSPAQLATPGDQPPPTALNQESSSSTEPSDTRSEAQSPAMRP